MKHRALRSPAAAVTALALAAAAALTATVGAGSASAATVPVGLGGYTDSRPAGTVGPTNSDGAPVTPKVTARMAGQAAPTNDWWSSLIYQRYAGNPYSENLYAHPFTFKAQAAGLEVGYPTTPTITGDGRQYDYTHTRDLTLGVAGLNSPDTKVDGWSDWTVTPYWSDGAHTFSATVGHGLPYVYAHATGGAAQVTAAGTPTVFANQGNVLGITVGGHNYGLFAPTGTSWTVNGTTISAALGTKDYYSVAVLPSQADLATYRTYAYSFVTDTKVSWNYQAAAGALSTTYTATTVAQEGTQTGTLLALYPHQWQATADALTGLTYTSPRGQMKVRQGNGFTTSQSVNGVLPSLPDLGGYDRTALDAQIHQVADAPDPFNAASDTYWTGKALGRLAQLVPVADQLGDTAVRDKMLGQIKGKLQTWFKGTGSPVFAYDSTWKTLTGYPASYGTDAELNDHHFHYGYYIQAAATVARYDSAWAADSAWGGMVKLLAKDGANADRADGRFPLLRNFDPYAGHGWASGHAGFAAGNNEESSSESLNFSSALVLYGSATGDTALRDLGVYLYTTEANAVQQYWFDADHRAFPANFQHGTVGMVWGSGAAYSTWWTASPGMIHGINFLPVTSGSLYLARRKDDLAANLAELKANNGGAFTDWRDLLWEAEALTDPAAAKADWDAGNAGYTPEEGESKAHTNHWINNLAALGAPDTTVTADSPTAAVFSKSGTRTHVAHNYTTAARSVRFSDGFTLTVPARSTASERGSFPDGGTGGVSPSPTPSASASTSPSPSPSPSTSTPPQSTGNTFYLQSGGALTTAYGTGAGVDTVPSAGGTNHDGTPYQAKVYEIRNVTGTLRAGGSTDFDLYLDAGASVGLGQQARISYDLSGDGTFDRVETYRYFATDPVTGWEKYTGAAAGLQSATGTLGNLSNGTVRIEVWSAIGNAAAQLRVGATQAQGSASVVRIPFN
ncbi:glycosyl hydrolase [Kitasatospora terrestris]|uniref:glucan endo-1,3-beta-D-glucosidase n=1 Tax=Kitasatospora terrestris TaxID=258051 RepID=A0ABP9DJ36_9ACTN